MEYIAVKFEIVEDNRQNALIGKIGNWRVLWVNVLPRYNTNNHKTNKNLAVKIDTSELGYTHRAFEANYYVPQAIKLLESIGVDVVEFGFINLLKRQGWASELPPQFNGVAQGGLF